MRVEARYYDGQTAGSEPVTVTLSGNQLHFILDTTAQFVDVQEVSVTAPVGKSGTWVIELADDAALHFDDEALGRRLAALRGQRGFVRRLESAWHYALLALVVSIVSTWALMTYGVPYAARQVAFALPADLMNSLGDDSMEVLDELMFSTSELSAENKRRVENLFADIRSSNADFAAYRLEFRVSNVGPNAFAVPGGIVVMTDELVEIAASDAEIAAVLAHEVGHLYHRHSLRILLQDSATALLIVSITGDLSSVTALSAAVPTMLMRAKYSRDFEREADAFAFAYLESRDIPTDVLSALLYRIEGNTDDDGVSSWFSTHPPTRERVNER